MDYTTLTRGMDNQLSFSLSLNEAGMSMEIIESEIRHHSFLGIFGEILGLVNYHEPLSLSGKLLFNGIIS